MNAEYIRRCRTCDAENAPSAMRCACGALLASVDPVLKEAPPVEPTAAAAVAVVTSATETPEQATQTITCPFPDCAQPNPSASETCVYCDRPLTERAMTPPKELHSLMSLPGKLKEKFRIVRPLPVGGAEAELLLVEPLAGGTNLIAKIYRHGIMPDREVLARIVKIAPEHRVKVFDADVSDGYSYELMEYCALGSWREWMKRSALSDELLRMLVHELSIAIEGVHAVGLVHRDLKPENILVRSEQPWDLVLTDFSISSILNATQCFTSTARTLNYASPESLSGVLDGKADYWSLGMIVLEAALGKHPFAGLSEAVILHHLTTRNIDVIGIADAALRKLVRGLLLRDPTERWGDSEIKRWLGGDASLPEPVEQRRMNGFAEPFHVGNEICNTPEQLAVAFTQNWKEGAGDISNGQLLAWFRNVQKDQNVVRLLLDMRQQRTLSVDVQLLRLILHLAPGIPLVWRGEPFNTQAILARANLALQGDADAAHWLDMIYQLHVLDIYAEAGNPEADNLVQKWNHAGREFERAWDEKLALLRHNTPPRGLDEYVNVDAMLFGNSGIPQPRLSDIHAQLLALAFDVKWAERMRERLVAELAGLMVHCPWLADLGDPKTMDAASLLVVDELLPEAKKIAERQIKAKVRAQDAAIGERKQIQDEIFSVITALRHITCNRRATRPVCTEVRRLINEYHDLLATARTENYADPSWQEMIKSAVRHRRTIDQMLVVVDELIEHRAENSGWFSTETLGFGGLLLIVFLSGALDMLVSSAPISRAFTGIVLVGLLGIAAWRFWPLWSLMGQIRELGEKL